MGIPKYNDSVANEIVERISEGEPLRAICRELHMPSWRSVYTWIDTYPDFASRIAHAREVGYDAIAEEALQIANTPEVGITEESGPLGVKTTKSDMLGHRKLQIETRLKLLAKWSPKKYGDRQAIDLGGSVEITAMSDEDIKAELALLTAAIHAAAPQLHCGPRRARGPAGPGGICAGYL